MHNSLLLRLGKSTRLPSCTRHLWLPLWSALRVANPQDHPCITIMARQLPAHLSHKSALALLPPASIAAPIETIRRAHDKHFARWPPHINLLYPFLASPSENRQEHADAVQLKEEVRMRIQKVVTSIEPFHVSLIADPPGTFSHSKRSKTVWLGPSTQQIQELQAALQAEFAECDADQRPFTPHLSVGQANSDDAAQKLREETTSTVAEFGSKSGGASTSLHWPIDKVYVIERKGFHGRFKVVGSIDLGE
jgi:2'-5' RNA ligase